MKKIQMKQNRMKQNRMKKSNEKILMKKKSNETNNLYILQ
jgi:hypothetical protein